MRMYGMTVESQFEVLRRLSGELETLIRKVDANPTSSLLMEAELAAASAQDHLRDMTLWLRGTREAIDRTEALVSRKRN